MQHIKWKVGVTIATSDKSKMLSQRKWEEGERQGRCLEEGMRHAARQQAFREFQQAEGDGVDGLGSFMPPAELLEI